MSDMQVTDNPAESRYEIHVDGVLAGWSEYDDYPDRRVVTHTVVKPEFEGQGVGSTLVRELLDDLRTRGLRLVASCPFVKSYLQRHPDAWPDGRAG